MAIKLIGNYAKRLGLPGYSSHQFSVSVEIELSDAGNLQGEAARLYGLLQDAVDREIHLGVAFGLGVLLAPGHRAEADFRDVEAGSAERSFFHEIPGNKVACVAGATRKAFDLR